jgi:hypothetical protein
VALQQNDREVWCRGIRGGCGFTFYLVAPVTTTWREALKWPARPGLIPSRRDYSDVE